MELTRNFRKDLPRSRIETKSTRWRVRGGVGIGGNWRFEERE
jgi:hypothetical protein